MSVRPCNIQSVTAYLNEFNEPKASLRVDDSGFNYPPQSIRLTLTGGAWAGLSQLFKSNKVLGFVTP